MTENETLDSSEREVQRSTSKRSKGALIGRFLAVGLFVALGTFAVIQSLGTNPPKQMDDGKTILVEKDAPLFEPKLASSKPVVKSISTFGSSASSKTPSMPKVTPLIAKAGPSGTFSKTLKPATSPLVTPLIRKPLQSTSQPVVAPIRQNSIPPANRIAQLPGASPRSTFGIGGPATTASKTVGGAINSLKQSAGNAATSVSNRFGQATQGISNKASEVTSQTRAAFGSTSSRFNAAAQQVQPTGNPFKKPPAALQKIEAKSSIDSLSQSRPFAADQNSGTRFRSQSLNPISSSSSGQRRTPEKSAPPRRNDSFSSKPARNDRFQERTPTRSSTARSSASRTSATSLPTTGTRASVIQASRVSSKPGDRQFEGIQSPSMIIQKFSPKEIQVNQTADFEVKIRNVGRIAVDDVIVVDRVPDGARFIDANPKPTSQSRTGELQWQLGTMNPGQERTILLQLEPTEPGEIGSVAQFYFGTRATNRTKVTQPKLRITHTADPKVLIGNNVVFDVTVENTGNGPAKDVIIQEEVPELLEYQDGSRELEYEIGTLQPGQSRRLQLGLRAARVGRLKNVMFASAKGGLQSKHQTDVEIIAPKLTTSSEGPTRRYIRRQVTHTFTVGNQGTAAATNLRLIARLPSGLRYVDANNRGRYDRNAHSVVWQMRDLAAGGSGDVEVVTTPVEGGEQPIKFEAEADLNQRSETVQNLNVEHLIDVFFDIDDVVDPIEIGADTRYQIRLVNQGTQAAANVQLQVDFPNGLEPVSVDGDLRNQIRGQQIVFEPITSLRSGEELKIMVVATGRSPGDHRIVVNMKADGRDTPVSKEETTRVYADQ